MFTPATLREVPGGLVRFPTAAGNRLRPLTPNIMSGRLIKFPSLIHGENVSGAGTAITNGVYTLTGISTGKNYYTLPATGGLVYWVAGAPNYWAITTNVGASAGTTYYYSFDDVATPDLVTTWVANAPGGGLNPVPTVTLQ